MQIYSGKLKRVIDGDTIEIDIDITETEKDKKRIRLKGIQNKNFNKIKHTKFDGAEGITAKYKVINWFAERSKNLIINVYNIDICGRWLSEVFAFGDSESINQFMLNNGKRSEYWEPEIQEEEKEEWFLGEVVIVPNGGELPEFHIWGKKTNKGGESNQLGRI